MRLQYRLSNGVWVDCECRTESFLGRCVRHGNIGNRAAVIAALESGQTVRNDSANWFSECRDGEYADAKKAEIDRRSDEVPMKKCSCGHTVPASSVMSASLGSSCPDCYDRMSD